MHVKITSTGPLTYRLELDGQDLSNHVTEAELYLSAMEQPRLMLELRPDVLELDLPADVRAVVDRILEEGEEPEPIILGPDTPAAAARRLCQCYAEGDDPRSSDRRCNLKTAHTRVLEELGAPHGSNTPRPVNR